MPDIFITLIAGIVFLAAMQFLCIAIALFTKNNKLISLSSAITTGGLWGVLIATAIPNSAGIFIGLVIGAGATIMQLYALQHTTQQVGVKGASHNE